MVQEYHLDIFMQILMKRSSDYSKLRTTLSWIPHADTVTLAFAPPSRRSVEPAGGRWFLVPLYGR